MKSGARVLRMVLNTVVAMLFASGLVVPMLTQDAPVGGWVGDAGSIASMPTPPPNVPTWTAEIAAQFPACGPKAPVPAAPVDVVVVDQDAHTSRLSFGAAWERGHNALEADDVWVVGYCR